MNYGLLSTYFDGIAAKRLKPVEVDTETSNQHEFNGVAGLKELLGTEEFSERPTTFIWLGDETEAVTEAAWVSWYDSRKGKLRAAEWRLYFPNNPVMEFAQPADLLLVARRPSGELLMIVVPNGSTLENQFAWLFGLDGTLGEKFRFEGFDGSTDRALDFAARYILEEIGVELEEPDTDRLDRLLEPFKGKFPTTREFSLLARDTCSDADPLEEPDATLVGWIAHEEALFRRLERHIVNDRLQAGFHADGEADVDGFLQFSLSVQNRRKSRMGLALENHLEELFRLHGLRYQRGALTENRAKPDFLFPGSEDYRDASYPTHKLSMLGAKSTCKDRWRQVLTEAARIDRKHLLTLEPGISENQTTEMKSKNLQLVVPIEIQRTYTDDQCRWLISTQEFIHHVSRQQKMS